jgi:TfoX/Sxy family transcriptional regulator of competence genes
MAYNEKLAARIRTILLSRPDVEEKKMMGGLTFMVNNKMCVGIYKDNLMARIGPEIYDKVMKKKGCKPMEFTGRPLKGFVFVEPDGTHSKKDLNDWVNLSLEYNKKAKSSKKRKKKK